MTKISDLPDNLAKNILSRVPLTCTRRVRFTCTRWNALSKDPSFAKKHIGGAAARLLILRSEFKVWLMSVGFHGRSHSVDPYVKEGKLTSLNNSESDQEVEISKVFHCSGLLLCLTKDRTRLVVWNPVLGQTRWIQPRNAYHKHDVYALGYDVNKNQKILRFLDELWEVGNPYVEHEIYDLKSDSWRVLDVTPDWEIESYQRGVSLKGRTYFFAKEKILVEEEVVEEVVEELVEEDFLLCFDFTAERFGPRLPLPFHSYPEETVTLSSVRDEQLAVLYQRDTSFVEIWVTSKIEPDEVSWNMLSFLSVDMAPLTGVPHLFAHYAGSFFIDEERKMAVVFDKDKEEDIYHTAYVIGENGYYREFDMEEDDFHYEEDGEPTDFPLVCSYFPSWVKIQQGGERGSKRKERD
ncbi:unnamed protein product [Microthlaspi erraticum]|uniref:F-box domain-containing protein n=1 Tax=Microthlaspi erraticum TaxID=1685480 RepID=A0A6D2KL86_9BRAS|nr:unnamed protein product [Microthlaspi erraticum]